MGSYDTELPYLKSNPKYIFFTDFDGTITQQDSNDYLTDTIGYGAEKRKRGNKDTMENRISFRDSFKEMMDSISTPYPSCIRLLEEHITLDPGFTAFLHFAAAANMPVVILSSGMRPIIQALLRKLVGPQLADTIHIQANEVRARPGKTLDDEAGWEIVFHDDSPFGHDKSLAIRPYAALPAGARPVLFYAGDGVSDLSAARETDLLFAKKGRDLVTYCVREEVPFTVFEDWGGIREKVAEIVEGKVDVQEAAREGWELYKKGAAGVKVDA